jgi:Domain of unknown function (DUF4440)
VGIRFVFLAVFAACSLHVLSAAADEAATVAQLQAAALELDKAYANQDMSTIKRMISSDSLSVAARYGGSASLAEQTKTFGELKRTNLDYTPIDVTLLGADVALVTFEKSYAGTYEGKALPPRVFVGEVWLKRDGKWLQRYYQETAIEKR